MKVLQYQNPKSFCGSKQGLNISLESDVNDFFKRMGNIKVKSLAICTYLFLGVYISFIVSYVVFVDKKEKVLSSSTSSRSMLTQPG